MKDKIFKYISINFIALWLFLLALVPFLLVVIGGFLQPGDHEFFVWHFTWQNYAELFQLPYLFIFLRSFYLAAVTAFFCLILGYPFAYILSKAPDGLKNILVFLMIIPFWTSSLIRIYSIIILIRAQGWINQFLMFLGIIHHPIQMLYTQFAVLLGLVYTLLPFMVLPLYANLEKFDWRLFDAARDLGANRYIIFRKVLIPLSVPGIMAGILLVFLPAVTLFYVPDVLGGAKSLLLGNMIKNQFIEAYNWPLGAALSVGLIVVMIIMVVLYSKISQDKEGRHLV